MRIFEYMIFCVFLRDLRVKMNGFWDEICDSWWMILLI